MGQEPHTAFSPQRTGRRALGVLLAGLVLGTCTAALGSPGSFGHDGCVALKSAEPSTSKAVSPGLVAVLVELAAPSTQLATSRCAHFDLIPQHHLADLTADRATRAPPTHS
jgi:hypothetical protein